MKKGMVIALFFTCVLLVSLVQAEEQVQSEEQVQYQTYSGWGRFVDNAKMFFSSGDGKVMLALEIREKEINLAIVNVQNGDDEAMSDNLENAWKKLQVVQEKVSLNVAEEVRGSSSRIRERIKQEENLSKDFDVYILEEEKTGLTAEWVVEVNGKEGQTLTREVVNTVGGENKGNRTVEIEERIGEIDVEISNWVVETSVGKDGEGDNGLTWEVKNEIAGGDQGLKPEVKNYVKGDGTLKNDPLPTPDLNKVNPDLYDPNARAPGDTIDVVSGDGGEGDYAEGTTADGDCGDGVDCGDGSADPGAESGVFDDVGEEGVNEEPCPAVDSNEGDSGDSGITGAVIKNSNSNNIIKRIFDWVF